MLSYLKVTLHSIVNGSKLQRIFVSIYSIIIHILKLDLWLRNGIGWSNIKIILPRNTSFARVNNCQVRSHCNLGDSLKHDRQGKLRSHRNVTFSNWVKCKYILCGQLRLTSQIIELDVAHWSIKIYFFNFMLKVPSYLIDQHLLAWMIFRVPRFQTTKLLGLTLGEYKLCT